MEAPHRDIRMARGSVCCFLLFLGLLPLCSSKAITQVFAFGDHFLDVGATTFFKNAIIKANFGPYSQSFKPRSGRFSNGQLTIDYISEYADQYAVMPTSMPTGMPTGMPTSRQRLNGDGRLVQSISRLPLLDELGSSMGATSQVVLETSLRFLCCASFSVSLSFLPSLHAVLATN